MSRRDEIRGNLVLTLIGLTASAAVWRGIIPAWTLLIVVGVFFMAQRGFRVIAEREQRDRRLESHLQEAERKTIHERD